MKYVAPEIKVIAFNAMDVITTSGDTNLGDNETEIGGRQNLSVDPNA